MRRTTSKLLWMVLLILLAIPAQAQVQLSLNLQDDATSYIVGDTVRFEVNADSSLTGLNALAMMMRLTYDDFYMIPINIESAGTLLSSAGWSVTPNTNTVDEIVIAAAGTTALADTGSVLFIDFELVRQGTGWFSFDANNTFFNESLDDIPLTFVNSAVAIGRKPTITVSIPSGSRIIGESFQAQVSSAVAPITWSLTDTTKASIDSLGIVTGKNIGRFGVIAEDSRGIIDTTDTEFLGFRLSAADTSNFQNQQVGVSIESTDLSGLNIFSGELFLRFDTSMVSLLSISPGDLMDNSASINYGMVQNGMSIVFAQTAELSGLGSLLDLEFQYDNRPFTNYYTIESIEFNESLTGVGSTFFTQSIALPNLSISSNSLPEYLVGDSLQFSVSNNNGPVSWSVSNSSLATIDENGTLFSLKGGSFRVSVEDSIGATAESSLFTFYDVKLTLPDTSMVLSDTLMYPIRIENVENSSEAILSTDFEITYPNTSLNYLGYSTEGSLTQGWSVVDNQVADNKIKVVAGGANEISSDGDIIYLIFRVDSTVTTDQISYPSFSYQMLNEGTPNALIDNGQIFISSKPLPPTLFSPTNNEQNVLLNAVLDWNKGVGATSYDVQLSTSSGFSSNIVDTSLVLTDSLLVPELTGSTTYFWRVRSVNDSGVSAWTGAYNFRTQDPKPLAPTLVSPVADVTNLEIMPTFNWTSVNFALNYRLQISNQADFSSTVTDTLLGSVTTFSSDSLDFGQTFYWRVFASNLTGESDPSESRMFSTIIEKPGIPQILTPPDSVSRADTVAFFTWYQVDRAETYNLQISETEDFSVIDYDQTDLIDTLTKQENLDYLTRYYWRLKAVNIGGESDWTTTRTFITKAIPVSVPVLEYPANDTTATDTSLVLSWKPDRGATNYRIQLSQNADFSFALTDTSGLDTFYQVDDLDFLTTYYWRVQSLGVQDTSAYSAPYSFTTKIQLPENPLLVSPTDGLTEQPLSIDLVWNSAARAAEYTIEVSDINDFSSLIINQTLTDTTLLTTGLTNLTDYFWRVKSGNTTGESEYSSVRTFQTKAVDATVPLLISPASGSIDTDTSLTLTWSSAIGALEYEYQVSDTSDFSLIAANGIGSDTTAIVVGLDFLTEYFWRARAIGAQDTSDWSGISNFTVRPEELHAPILLSPGNGSIDVPDSVVFLWSSVFEADGYVLELDDDTTTIGKVVLDALNDTTASIDKLKNSTRFLWRVKSTDSILSRESVWSPWFDFTTIAAPNDSPILYDTLGILVLDEDFDAFEVADLDTMITDPEALALTYQLVSSPGFVTTNLDGNNILRVQSIPDTSGVGNIIVTAIDDIGQSVTDTLFLSVLPVNDFPFVVELSDSLEFQVGSVFEFFIDTAFADVEDELADLDFNVSANPIDVFAVFDPSTYRVSLTSPSYIGFADLSITVTDSDGGEITEVIVIEVLPLTSNESISAVPVEFTLQQNYPNPFNPSSTINFGIPEASDVRIDVFNMLGQHVVTLVDKKMQAGNHSVIFEASGLSSGTYIYRIVAGEFVQTKRMMLIK